MKVQNKTFRKDGEGDIKLTPEHEEDLWHVFNLVREGDKIRASTTRKIQVRYASLRLVVANRYSVVVPVAVLHSACCRWGQEKTRRSVSD
jgi:stalled ribosome rescue protein Dom34